MPPLGLLLLRRAFHRGTLVAVRSSEFAGLQFGLYDANLTDQRLSKKFHLILQNGRVSMADLDDIVFSAPVQQWLTSKQRVDQQIQSQRELKSLLIPADTFIRRGILTYRQEKSHFDSLLYPKLKSMKDSFDLNQATHLVFGDNATTVQKFSVLNYLFENPMLFIAERFTEDLIKYRCRPEDEVQTFRQLISAFQPSPNSDFRQFIAKLRRLTNGEHKVNPELSVTFSDTEKLYLKSVDRFSHGGSSSNRRHPDVIIAEAVLSHCYYPTDKFGAKKLLEDTGIRRHWDFHVPCWALVHEAVDKSAAVSAPDNVHTIRHDFGQLPAFAIDDLTAEEIDDAISIETDPNDPDRPWIHVHVADPTAHVEAKSSIGQHIIKKASNIYLAERTLSLFDEDLVQEKMSLSSHRPNLTLSVSFKLNSDGSVADWKIRPGYVRQLHSATYDQVDQLLSDVKSSALLPQNLEEEWKIESFIFSPEGTRISGVDKPLEDSLVQFRSQIMELESSIGKHFVNRVRNGAFTPITPRPSILLSETEKSLSFGRSYESRFFEDSPTVRLAPGQTNTSISRVLVAECMIIAGSIVAQFAHETKTPIVYRCQPSVFNQNAESRRFIETLLQTADNGFLSIPNSEKLFPYIPASFLSPELSPHSMLALNTYAQSTSPLRRVNDLLTHWQIKAKLLEIAGHPTLLPFDKDSLTELLPALKYRESKIKKLQRKNISHWVNQFLVQRFQTKAQGVEMPPMMAFVFEKSIDDTAYLIYVKDICQRYHLRKYLLKSHAARIGTWIPVDVVAVEFGEAVLGEC